MFYMRFIYFWFKMLYLIVYLNIVPPSPLRYWPGLGCLYSNTRGGDNGNLSGIYCDKWLTASVKLYPLDSSPSPKQMIVGKL